jgi:tRNA modification GTPase
VAAQTIYALSTAPGRAAIAIVRISGRQARDALLALAGRLPTPKRASLAVLRSGGEILDHALALWFPGPQSATGEDLAELHLHGGPAVVRRVLAALGALPGFRLAEPGEFTRRAFGNERLDLTQAEGLADLIHAETEAQAAQALLQLDGAFGGLVEGWRLRLLRALAMVEAVIDFPDEDVPDSAALSVAPDLRALAAEIAAHLADGHRGEITRDGLAVVILGAPNAGKSSLLNALARRDVAIVSEIPGTTRDAIEVSLNLGGYAVSLIDTAGLRETAERIEGEGIRRALARAGQAHLRLAVIDCADPVFPEQVRAALRPGDLVVWNKRDLGTPGNVAGFDSVSVSAVAGQGLAELVAWLTARAATMAGAGGSPLITRARHREALEACHAGLVRGLEVLAAGLDVAAEDLRLAARALGRITGRVDVEDVLDVVFAEFCIGK